MKERQLSPARLARTLGLVVAAATLGAFGDVASPASAATADSLSYTSVEGALVHGPVTLRARTWGPVREVRFAIDGPAHRYWVDRSAPFYINGGPGNLWARLFHGPDSCSRTIQTFMPDWKLRSRAC